MAKRQLIAEAQFDIRGSVKTMRLRFFKPTFNLEMNAWGCEYVYDEPFDIARRIYGENSLQALTLALKVASSDLYESDLYKSRSLGIFGEYGGNLLLPLPSQF